MMALYTTVMFRKWLLKEHMFKQIKPELQKPLSVNFETVYEPRWQSNAKINWGSFLQRAPSV